MLVRALILLSFVVCSMRTEAGLPFTSETVSWDEEILLTDGRLLKVYRSATYGPDEWGRSGRGRLKTQSIRFFLNGKKIKWENSDSWPITYMPDILDISNGIPILILPVHRWGPCEKYDFPQEGLVAFAYRNRSWDQIALSDLPIDLRVNLLRSTHAIQHWKEYRNKLITPKMKQDLERTNWGATKQGQSIAEAGKVYSGYEDSCARIRPLPQPQLEAARKENFEAEMKAPMLVAIISHSSKESEMVTREGYRAVKGRWTGSGFLADSCQGIVEGIEPIRQYRDGGGWRRVGFTVLLKERRQVPIQEMNLETAKALAYLDTIYCDTNLIYVLRRKSKEHLIAHRFTHAGALIDAMHIKLAEVEQYFPDKQWATIWDVATANGLLNLGLVEYSYKGTADQGGIIEQRLNYTIQLPAISPSSATHR